MLVRRGPQVAIRRCGECAARAPAVVATCASPPNDSIEGFCLLALAHAPVHSASTTAPSPSTDALARVTCADRAAGHRWRHGGAAKVDAPTPYRGSFTRV